MSKNINDLITIMRNVTGRVDASDPLFTDTIMGQYLNDFVTQLSSQDIRIFKNYTWWEFDITPSTPNPMPVPLQQLGFTTIGPYAYVQLPVVPTPSDVTDIAMVGTIDGSNQIFSLQAQEFIIPGTFVVFGSNPLQMLEDDGLGGFTGNGSGSINYDTGFVNVIFTTPPAIGSTVVASYSFNNQGTNPPNSPQFSFELWWFQDPQSFYARWPDRLNYTPQRPTAVLYYNNELLFRGPPDQEYHIKIQAYRQELQFTAEGSLEADYLFRYLAYGASLDIFSDYGEMDKWSQIYPVFQRYRALVYARTNCQYQSQRPNPEF
jgi:hypothetical protein